MVDWITWISVEGSNRGRRRNITFLLNVIGEEPQHVFWNLGPMGHLGPVLRFKNKIKYDNKNLNSLAWNVFNFGWIYDDSLQRQNLKRHIQRRSREKTDSNPRNSKMPANRNAVETGFR